jgi:hypothetical protein
MMNLDLYLPIYKILNKYQNQHLSKEFIFQECIFLLQKYKHDKLEFNDDFQKYFLLHILTISCRFGNIEVNEDENHNIDSLALLSNKICNQKTSFYDYSDNEMDSQQESYEESNNSDNEDTLFNEVESDDSSDEEEDDDSDEDYEPEEEDDNDSDEDYDPDEGDNDSDEDYVPDEKEEDDDSDEDYVPEEESDNDSDEDYVPEEEDDDNSDEDYDSEEDDDDNSDKELYDTNYELNYYDNKDIIEFGLENINKNIFIKQILSLKDHHGNNFMHMLFKYNNKNLIDEFMNKNNTYLLCEKNNEGLTPIDYMSNKILKLLLKKNIEKSEYIEIEMNNIACKNDNNINNLNNKIDYTHLQMNIFGFLLLCLSFKIYFI